MFGMAKFGAGKTWHQFLNSIAKFATKFPDCGKKQAYTAAIGFLMLAVISWRLLNACCSCLMAPGCWLIFSGNFWMLDIIS